MELLNSNRAANIFKYLGRQPPRRNEVQLAEQILGDSPNTSPLDVAKYFEQLTITNEDSENYNSEWSVRANPLIVLFFLQGTNYDNTKGDETAWCAAFVNWCLKRAGEPYTNSASSGSFRCFCDEAITPKEGDIAVFKKNGHDDPCAGEGHVGFYVSEESEAVTLLGGNQGGKVKTQGYSKQGRDLIYLGARAY